MRRLAPAALLAALVGAAPAVVGQQVDVTRLGPGVGARVPALALVDQDGRRQTLESIAGPKGTMLVFFRSADW
ncbi:MAG TPA: hypothetical protein VMM93_09500 [Vicinamibacterales bacterium]|nr:hypothetical protein [Vicinamibacterales bacterium]